MANHVKIEVLGSPYLIETNEDEEYVLSLAEQLNNEAAQLLQQNSKLSAIDALILCCLSYVDSAKKSEESADNLRAQLSSYLDEIKELKRK